ncbi:Hypothetical predicted protein [Podarcis lilfordi]|uniref:Uncharacterized protein n=1 Tax=Podarcis lilfordi TaxID=74358 RepID=A0AA35KHM0_9SAUR|nr:Hypothetical predicted protein [Podarcis lilfordi]
MIEYKTPWACHFLKGHQPKAQASDRCLLKIKLHMYKELLFFSFQPRSHQASKNWTMVTAARLEHAYVSQIRVLSPVEVYSEVPVDKPASGLAILLPPPPPLGTDLWNIRGSRLSKPALQTLDHQANHLVDVICCHPTLLSIRSGQTGLEHPVYWKDWRHG